MLHVFRALASRLRIRQRDPDRVYERPVSNLDAATAAASQHHTNDPNSTVGGYPPGYVKAYDEGRPRK
jgi:hypothetical protein